MKKNKSEAHARSRRKLSDDAVLYIKRRYKAGIDGRATKLAHADFAQAFEVSTQVIHNILNEITYRDVQNRRVA